MDKQTAKLIARIAENLPEMPEDVMQGWIENPKSLQEVLKNILCPPEATPDFKIWKTIKLGTGLKTDDDFRKALKGNRCGVSDWANDILGKPAFTAATEEIEVDLVKVTVDELGFKKGARHDQIYDCVRELGLEICSPEVGPQLRLQYKDQPNGEWILIGMEPITDSGGRLGVFGVGCGDSGLSLFVSYGDPGWLWFSGGQWVFVRPRK